MDRKPQIKNADDRPIKSKGHYDMNFIDWDNEWNQVYSQNYNFNDPSANTKSPIAGMSLETFQKLLMDEFETFQYQQEQEVQEQNKLSSTQIGQIKQMKMGQSSKECTICFKKFEKGEIIMKLPCNHIFHRECICPWFNKESRCPNCRFDLKEHFQKQ